MTTTYKPADSECLELIQTTMAKYHGGLRDAGVTVQCLFAIAPVDKYGEPTGAPAIRHQGRKCAATIRTTKLEERVQGASDLEIKIDLDNWEVMDEEERIGLLDHELYHRVLKVDAKGKAVRDDIERPLFLRRDHDREAGWFDVVAKRHGKKSMERKALKLWESDETFCQCYLPGFGPLPLSDKEPKHTAQIADHEPRNVTTADGRQITAGEMVDEIKADFAATPIAGPKKARRRR